MARQPRQRIQDDCYSAAGLTVASVALLVLNDAGAEKSNNKTKSDHRAKA